MKRLGVCALLAAVLCLLAAVFCLPAHAAEPVVQGKASFQTFEVPGTPVGISNLSVEQISDTGFVSGYVNAPNAFGILRLPDGKIVDLNDPLSSPVDQTYGAGVNANGTVVGYYWDAANSIYSGFFFKDGKFETYNVPGLPAESFTFLLGINDYGAFSGVYEEPPYSTAVPFVSSGGRIDTNFNIPASIYTEPIGVNDLGQVAGIWLDSAGTEHGFVRQPNGRILYIDVPGASSYGSAVEGINNYGWVSGHFWEGDNNYEHGFVLSPQGVFYQIDVPDAATTLAGGGTSGGILNDEGVLAGHYDPADLSKAERGYLATLEFYPR